MITNYKQLTINKYQEIRQILKDDGGELNIQARIVAMLNDMDLDTVLNLSLTKYNELVRGSAFLMEKPKLDGRIPSKLNINGRECVVTKNVSKLTTGQYIDYQSYIAADDQEKYLANVLACFIIPRGHSYGDGYDTDEIAQWLGENLSIQDAMNICFFFRKKYLESINLTLTCLELTMKRLKRKMKSQEAVEKMEELTKLMKQYRTLLQESGDGLLW